MNIFRLDTRFEEILSSYPDSMLSLSGIGENATDFGKHFDDLMNSSGAASDASSDPNANISSITAATAVQEAAKPLQRLHCLQEIFLRTREKNGADIAERVLRRILDGLLYPSDLHLFGMPYCYNMSASQLMTKGLPFIPRTPSAPAKHADSFAQHALQLIVYASNHQSGAVALTGFFVAYAWYAKRDGLSKKEMTQEFQKLVYSLNQPVRYSVQTPFVNLSIFDRNYLKDLYGQMQMPDGTLPDIEWVMTVQRIFTEWFVAQPKATGTIFTFPVLTANILLDPETRKPRDSEFVDWLARTNSPSGLVNIYASSRAGSLSSCCRLSNDIDLLAELGYMNSFGAGGDGIGSVGVCTVNLSGVALESRKTASDKGTDPEKEYEALLESVASDARRVVEVRRAMVETNVKKGLLPLYTHGFIDLNSQYCTVGITGMYEAGHFLGRTADLDEYMKFAKRSLSILNEGNLERAKETGIPFNLEQVPGENMAVKMAEKDKARGLQTEFRIYSNQWLPLASSADVFTRIEFAGELDPKCSGGAILHLTVDGKITAEAQRRILDFAVRKGVVYFAFNTTMSKCASCGWLGHGEFSSCPECGAAGTMEAWTRVVGFVTPVSDWNRERRAEFGRRTRYQFSAKRKDMTEEALCETEDQKSADNKSESELRMTA